MGEIVAAPWRGALMGNRGRLHEGRLLTGRRWTTPAWVACALSFKGRRRAPMPKHGYTALFFWDEAAAFAAGHLPCGECRHADHARFREAAVAAGLPARAVERHRAVHAARVRRDGSRVLHEAAAAGLPDGTVVLLDGAPALIFGDAVRSWRPEGGWGVPRPRPTGRVTVLTPAPVATTFRAGYRPDMVVEGQKTE